MRILLKSICCMILSITAVFSGSSKKAEELFTISGLNKEFKIYPTQIAQGVINGFYSPEYTEQNKKVIDSIVHLHFNKEVISKEIKEQLLKKVSSRDIRKLHTFYNSSLGKKIIAIESQDLNKISPRKLRQFDFKSISDKHKSKMDIISTKRTILSSLLEVTKFHVYAKQAVIQSDPTKKITKEEQDKKLDKTISFTKQMLTERVQKTIYLVYSPLTLSELSSYTKFLKRKEYSKLHSNLTLIRHSILQNAISKLEKDVASTINTPYYASEDE